MKLAPLLKIYRRLVVISVGAWLLGTLLPYVESSFWPKSVNDLLEYHGWAAVFPLSQFLFWAFALFGLWARASLWSFAPVARKGLLILLLANAILILVCGVSVNSPIVGVVYYLGNLADAAVLTLAYWSPLRRKFRVMESLESQHAKES